MRFRFHRGGLKESLATTVMVNSQAELRDIINDKGGYLDKLTAYDRINFVAQPTFSTAMREAGHWETHLVTINGDAIGYSDGAQEYEMPVERRQTPENRLPQTFDPTQYQAMLVQTPGGSKSIKVADLSHADTAQMLCMAMTVITRLEEDTNVSSALIDEWHNGQVKPDLTIQDRLRALMQRGIDEIDAQGVINQVGYLSQAREKMVSAVSCLEASAKQPKDNQ